MTELTVFILCALSGIGVGAFIAFVWCCTEFGFYWVEASRFIWRDLLWKARNK